MTDKCTCHIQHSQGRQEVQLLLVFSFRLWTRTDIPAVISNEASKNYMGINTHKDLIIYLKSLLHFKHFIQWKLAVWHPGSAVNINDIIFTNGNDSRLKRNASLFDKRGVWEHANISSWIYHLYIWRFSSILSLREKERLCPLQKLRAIEESPALGSTVRNLVDISTRGILGFK